MGINYSKSRFSKKFAFLAILVLFFSNRMHSQASSIQSGVTFHWADTQSNLSDPATIDYIDINGNIYNSFVVPTSYELTRLGPGGHNDNNIWLNGSRIVNSSAIPTWNDEAIAAFQSLNLNYYFESDQNGDNICGNYGAIAGSDSQIQTIRYSPGIPSNPDGVIAITERGMNNCYHIALYGIPSGGGPEQLLGQTFVINGPNQSGVQPQAPPPAGADFWLSGRNNNNNQVIGIALFELSSIAPIGSTITSIEFMGATNDVGDGKFFLMQTYAVDDIFETDFETVFTGDVGVNDNVPSGSTYTYLPGTDPLNGTVAVNPDGTFTYTPNANFAGTDTFEVQVCLPPPNQLICETSTVTLTVKPGVSINDTSANEGNNMTFTITSSHPLGEDVTFDIDYTDGSAISADYNGPSSVTLPSGSTTVTFDVSAIDDDWVEETNQTFDATISYPSGTGPATITDGIGEGTVIDTDVAYLVGGNFSITEGGTIQYRLFLSTGTNTGGQQYVGIEDAYNVDFSVEEYPTSANPATEGADFNGFTTTVTFPANAMAGAEIFIPVPTLDDNIIEETEEFNGVKSRNAAENTKYGVAPSRVSINTERSVLRILDNDGGVGNGLSFDTNNITVDEGDGTATFSVILTGNVQGGFTVDYNTNSGSATDSSDFTGTSGQLTFAGNDGESQNIVVPIIDDTLIEPSEYFTVLLSNLSTSLITVNGDTATGNITDNDGGAGSGVSVAGFTVDEAAGTATFEVSLNADVQGGFSVDYDITDGSATAGSDYTATMAGTLNFAGNNGEVQQVTVNITDDTLIEGTEDLSIALSNLSTALINIVGANATGNITDNDGGAGSGVSVAGFTVDEAAGTATFEVSLNADVQGGFSVDYDITDGSATAGSDYTATMAGTLNFAGNNGEVQQVTVNITDDTLIEGTEDLSIALSNLSTALINIVGANATGNITDNDGGAGSGVSVAGFTVDEAAGTATFEVSLNADVQGGFSVDYDITDGSATAGSDYTATMAGTLNFAGNNGEVQQVTVNITDDTLIEGTEDLSIALSNLSTALINIVGANATGNITDNDGGAGSGVSVAGFTVDEAAGTATFEVSLNADVQGGFSVDYDITDGSATAGSDYTATMAGTLNFAGNNGEVQQVTVNITDDTLIEGTEDLSIALSNLSTALINIVGANATGNITDNDGGAGSGVSVAGFTVDEAAGTATFEVSLNADVQGGFSVDYDITDGSATAGSDYTATMAGTLNFAGNNGEVQQVTVNITDDTLIEGTEDLSIALSNLSTALINIVGANATGNITDNDGGAGSGVSVAGFTVDEAAGTATFEVSLNADVQGGFSVDYDITDGSATAGSDYTATMAGTLNFAGNNGEVQQVTVNITDDTLIEGTEDLSIALSNLSTALINIVGANATGNITDNDGGAGSGVSVAGFTVDEAAGTATFEVSLNADVQGGFSVDYDITDGSATAGSDYTATMAGTLNFAGNNGEVQQVTVNITDDTLIEGTEDLSIALSNLSTALINIVGANATGNITDNDGGAGSGVSVAGFTVDEAAGTATFEVSLNADVQGGFSVDYDITDGSATAGSDYTATMAGTLNFAGNNGEVQQVTVNITDDTLIEGTEDLSIALSNLSTALINIVGANATGNITDNDGGAGSGVSVAGFTVDEAAGTATFEVSLNADVQGGFSVDYDITDGSATAGSDYTATMAGTLNFAGNNGEVQQVTVNITDDTLIEGTEDLSIALSNLSTALINIVGANATGNITDNDGGAGSGVSVAGFTVDEAAGTATFEVSLNADVQGGFSVDYDITDGSATAGSDYTATMAGTLNFAGNNGEVQQVTVNITDDTLIEGTEDLSIALSNLSTALINIVGANATGNITDNDGGAGSGVSVAGFTVDEAAGTATFEVSLNADVQGGFSVDYDITDGSATAGSDYTATMAGTLNFAGNNGEVQQVTVNITDDTLIEGTEDLSIALSNLSTALINIVGANATGNITDNDNIPGVGLSFDNTDVTVNEDAGTATFTVRLTGNVQGGFTVDYATNDGSAVNPGDYASANGTLTFVGNNSESYDITVPIVDDNLIEALENYTVVLTNLSTPLIPINGDTATGGIVDNDNIPGVTGLSFDNTDVTVNEDAGTATFTVQLTGNVQGGFTVDYATNDGSAVNPGDYASANGTLTFVGNDSESFDITVPIIDDVIVETTEGYTVVLSNLSTTIININGDTANGGIVDNDSNNDFPVDVTVTCDAVPSIPVIVLNANGCTYTENFVEDIVGLDDGCDTEYTITRTWTITDCVGNVRIHTQTIIVEDNEAPTFVESLPADSTVSCDSVPAADTLTAIDNCDTNASVTFDEQITDDDTCASNYIITRTWTAADCAGNQTVHVQTIIVEDTQAPTFVEALPESFTALCNEVPDAVTLTAIDNCDSDVTVVFDEVVTNDENCMDGYTVTRTWSVSDCAGNVNTHTQVITVEPTGPITASDYSEEVTILCGDEIPAVPELTFMGGCGNYDVTFTEERQDSGDTDDYIIIRTWEVTDSCGNMAEFEQIIFVMQPQLEEVFIDICVEDDAIDLLTYLPEGFDANGTFEVLEGNVTLQGSMFDPLGLETGEFRIAYSSIEGDCKYFVDFIITTNSDCVPCTRDEIEVSKTVTANGDNINDFFEIKGVEYCDFTFDVMIFNRWGDKVFEAVDYQNDWGGYAPNNAVGNSGMLPSGTYYYIINVNGSNFEPLNGYIFLGGN